MKVINRLCQAVMNRKPLLAGIRKVLACAFFCSVNAACTTTESIASERPPVAPANLAAPAVINGPFELHQALTFYVVNESGAAFDVQLRYRNENQDSADRPVLIRVFDPQEHLLLRQEIACERVPTAAEILTYERTLQVPATKPGVYQVAMTGFSGQVHFSTSPSFPWGIFGHPRLVGRGDQFAAAFVYLPPGLDRLPIRCTGAVHELKLVDEAGESRVALHGTNPSATAALPASGEHVWKLCIKAPAEYQLDFAGLPIILCPDAQTARAIHASVDILDDGTICFHKFQVRAHRLLQRYRRMPAQVYHVDTPVLARYANEFLAQPTRNELLFGGAGVYATLPATLHEQNLNPDSPWFGTIYTWRDGNQRERTDNPWTSYTRLGLTRVAEPAANLAAVYAIDKPFNPLYKNQSLRIRVVIAAIQELMMLREYEMPDAVVADNYFGGERAFTFSSFVQSFPMVVRDCPANVRKVWTDGLRRYVDHESISDVALTVNQWSFIVRALQHFYDGTGEETYRHLVQRHLRWIMTRSQWNGGQQPAGYFDEGGPDATYMGITMHNLAWVYKQTHDPSLREALRRAIHLMNHTIAPQPDGSWLGASSFATRTPGNWSTPQFGGGMAMLADELPEAAPHVGRAWPTPRVPARNAIEQRVAVEHLRQRLVYLDPQAYFDKELTAGTIMSGPGIFFTIWQHFANHPLQGQLPMVAERHFTRNFGDEFFCVRRPSYYAFLYAGVTIPEWQKHKRAANPRQQHPRNGGGLSMFWSPSFGSSLLSQNWSAYAAQTIIAEHPNGTDWEDYWSVQQSFNEQTAEATITGMLRDQPMQFRREYRFLHDRILCDVHLTAQQDVQYNAMWECFAYPLEPSAHLLVSLEDENGAPVRNRPASAIVFRNASPEAHVIVFAKPRVCDVGVDASIDAYQNPRKQGRVLAALPTHWNKNESQTVRWCILSVPVEQVAQSIREAIAAMNQ